MKITIEIPDEELQECVKDAVVKKILENNTWGSGREFRREYGEIIKELIYQPDIKQGIIDSVTDKAAEEIRKKGMPVLMEKLIKGS